MKKALIAAGIAIAIVIAIAGAYVSLTEPTPEGAMESTTPQPSEPTTPPPSEPTTQQTGEEPSESTEPRRIVVEVEETLSMGESP